MRELPLGGDLLECDFCNIAYHNNNNRGCLFAGKGAQFERIPAEHKGDWACPKCWQEAIKKYSRFKVGNGKRRKQM